MHEELMERVADPENARHAMGAVVANGGAGYRWDDHRAVGESYRAALGKYLGQALGGVLEPQSPQACGDPEAFGWEADAGHTDGR